MNFPIQNNANVASNTFTGTVISVDSSIKQGCGHAVTSLVIQKNHGQLLVESAHHSLVQQPNQKCPRFFKYEPQAPIGILIFQVIITTQ